MRTSACAQSKKKLGELLNSRSHTHSQKQLPADCTLQGALPTLAAMATNHHTPALNFTTIQGAQGCAWQTSWTNCPTAQLLIRRVSEN